jgi:C1A family cysteine protease
MKLNKKRFLVLCLGIPAYLWFAFTTGNCNASTVDVINDAINKSGAKWVAGKTPMVYMSPDQRKMYLGLIRHPGSPALTNQLSSSVCSFSQRLPASFDWRDANGGNYVTPIRDQASCGSCWSFAATAALESAVLIDAQLPGTPLDLSEQVLVSCMGISGCSGGYIEDPLTFFNKAGLAKESCYPYLGTDTGCSPCASWQESTFKVEDWYWISYATYADIDTIKSALFYNGPLIAVFTVFNDFFYYSSGVYSHAWGEVSGSHAVLVVGWDDRAEALIVKNSWGPLWGENGYFRIAYSELSSDTLFASESIAIEKVSVEDTCRLISIKPAIKHLEGSGSASGSVQVFANESCTWTAASNASWITITSGVSGKGSGRVSYSVAAKTGKEPRTGTLTIGGEIFTLVQGSWVTQTVDGQASAGGYPSIACDTNGAAHIGYYDYGSGALKYATNASGSWTAAPIGINGNVGTQISLKVDKTGHAYMSYCSTSDLKYATNASGSWQITLVDSPGYVGLYSSLALDGQSHGYISYYDALNTGGGRLKFATNKQGEWISEVVDNTGNMGQYTSIGLDSTGTAHISYYDAQNCMLKYATDASGAWQIATVDAGDNESDPGMYTSLAVDSQDKVHISYFAPGITEYGGVLKYATNASGSWQVETVVGEGTSGMYCSLALDSSDNPHISYHYAPTQCLRYAAKTSEGWQLQTIDSTAGVGQDTSIAIDSAGNAHVSYLDFVNYVLKYATDRDGVIPIYTLYIKMLGSGSGTVTGGTNGIMCSWNCTEAFTRDTVITLKAIPNKSIFTGWGGVCSGKGDCTVTMDESKDVSATFKALCPAQMLLGQDNANLENLLDFRDKTLAKNAIGRKVISIYYNKADSINAALERRPALRAFTKKVLEVIAPMVGRKQ